jgi:hypothetical protein
LPAEWIAYATQGAAIDWWLRFLTDADGHPDLGIARAGRDALLPGDGPQALMDLATDVKVADLIALRDSAREVFLPHLPPGPVHTGPTFEGSRLLPADADLIASDCLIECKATIGGPPRKVGTRTLKFDSGDLFQFLGYALMDFSDHLRDPPPRPLRTPVRLLSYLAADSGPRCRCGGAARPGPRPEHFERMLSAELPPFLAETYGLA